MSKIETLKHSCVICQDHDYKLEAEPNAHPESNARWVKSITCITCGYPISALEYFESESGLQFHELTQYAIN